MKYSKLSFEAFGVTTCIETNDSRALAEIISAIRNTVPGVVVDTDPGEIRGPYRIQYDSAGGLQFFVDDVLDVSCEPTNTFLPYFMSLIRLRIAERAVSRVFVHAGAVEWKGRALIFPASSFKGKTTVVAELVKNGAGYLSDEYAVFDQDGMIHPFPKTLSVRTRGDGFAQTEIPVEHYGGRQATGPCPPGMIIFTEFCDGVEWDPVVLSPGQGMLEILSHTIPIRYDPKFSLKVLNNVLNRAIIAKSKRGDASQFAESLLNFCQHHFI